MAAKLSGIGGIPVHPETGDWVVFFSFLFDFLEKSPTLSNIILEIGLNNGVRFPLIVFIRDFPLFPTATCLLIPIPGDRQIFTGYFTHASTNRKLFLRK